MQPHTSFTLSSSELRAAVRHLTPIAKDNPGGPVIKLEWRQQYAHATAHDGKQSLTFAMKQPVPANGEGRIFVGAKALATMVRDAPAGDIAFTYVSGTNELEIHGPNFHWVMACADDAVRENQEKSSPAKSGGEYYTRLICDNKRLKDLLKNALSFVVDEKEKRRQYLNGALFCYEDENAVLVSTNGHALFHGVICRAERSTWPVDDEHLRKTIIPASAMRRLVRLIPQDGLVSIDMNDQLIRFITSGMEYVTHFVDGFYPDYPSILNSVGRIDNIWEFDHELLRDTLVAIKRTALNERAMIQMICESSSAAVNCVGRVRSGKNGEAVNVLQVTALGRSRVGGAGKITLDADYLADSVAALGNGKIEIHSSSDKNIVGVFVVNKNDNSRKCMIARIIGDK